MIKWPFDSLTTNVTLYSLIANTNILQSSFSSTLSICGFCLCKFQIAPVVIQVNKQTHAFFPCFV